MVRLTGSGDPETAMAAGVAMPLKAQLTPAAAGTIPHVNVTFALNDPNGLNWKFTGCEIELRGMVTLAVESGSSAKSTTRSRTGCTRTFAPGSEPMP